MLSGKYILVVDQDPLMREILEDSLHLFNCTVFSAGTIKDALEVLANDSIDAVICEDHLERGTGLELLTRMKNCDLDLPFALMTGSGPDLCRETVFAVGVGMVFEKPFGLDQFLDGVRQLIPLTSPNPAAQDRIKTVLW
jgi:two-component system C4-dicarboxylate transport response regulator DctD